LLRPPPLDAALHLYVLDAGAPLRVVVCDDTEDTRDLFADALRWAGHEVTVVADGASAIAAITKLAPHVAVIDIGLPDISGYDVVRAVRAAAVERQPRLVAVTGFGTPGDHAAAFAAGFDAHLTKPASLRALLAAVRGQSDA
jgi:CheY-like chemotaxis protein